MGGSRYFFGSFTISLFFSPSEHCQHKKRYFYLQGSDSLWHGPKKCFEMVFALMKPKMWWWIKYLNTGIIHPSCCINSLSCLLSFPAWFSLRLMWKQSYIQTQVATSFCHHRCSTTIQLGGETIKGLLNEWMGIFSFPHKPLDGHSFGGIWRPPLLSLSMWRSGQLLVAPAPA